MSYFYRKVLIPLELTTLFASSLKSWHSLFETSPLFGQLEDVTTLFAIRDRLEMKNGGLHSKWEEPHGSESERKRERGCSNFVKLFSTHNLSWSGQQLTTFYASCEEILESKDSKEAFLRDRVDYHGELCMVNWK